MALQNFIDRQSPVVSAAWLNAVDRIKDTWLGTTAAETTAGVVPAAPWYPPGDLRRYGGVGDGSTADDTALASAALQAVQSQGSAIFVEGGSFRISANTTLAVGVCLLFGGQGSFALDVAKTLTINGQVIAFSNKIFTGSGAVVFGASSPQKAVYVEWFGAVAGGSSATNTTAIQAALDAHPKILLGVGTYSTNAACQMNDANFIEGVGRASVIAGTHAGAVLKGKNVTTAATTNVRRYNGGGRDFKITGPGRGTAGGIALDMRGCTMFKWQNLLITDIERAVYHGDGYSSYYNEYLDVDCSTVIKGYENSTLGNENKVWGGRINDCTTGTQDNDCSGNLYDGVAIEVFTTGHLSSDSAAALYIRYLNSRLENVPTTGTGIDIRALAQDNTYFAPQMTGLATDVSNAGLRTNGTASEDWRLASGTRTKYHASIKSVIDFPNILAQTSNDQLVAITGALATDSVYITADAALPAGLTVTAIPAAGGVYVRCCNITVAAINPASMTFTIDIWRHA